jgi:hypothetical protein
MAHSILLDIHDTLHKVKGPICLFVEKYKNYQNN